MSLLVENWDITIIGGRNKRSIHEAITINTLFLKIPPEGRLMTKTSLGYLAPLRLT